eukprot:192931-Chlamydomonas_euryale.AAC.1
MQMPEKYGNVWNFPGSRPTQPQRKRPLMQEGCLMEARGAAVAQGLAGRGAQLLVGWLVVLSVGQCMGSLVGLLVDWSIGRLVGRSVGWVVGCAHVLDAIDHDACPAEPVGWAG